MKPKKEVWSTLNGQNIKSTCPIWPHIFLGIFGRLSFLDLTKPFPGLDTWHACAEKWFITSEFTELWWKRAFSLKTSWNHNLLWWDIRGLQARLKTRSPPVKGRSVIDKQKTHPPNPLFVPLTLTNVGLGWTDSNLNSLGGDTEVSLRKGKRTGGPSFSPTSPPSPPSQG